MRRDPTRSALAVSRKDLEAVVFAAEEIFPASLAFVSSPASTDPASSSFLSQVMVGCSNSPGPVCMVIAALEYIGGVGSGTLP